MPADLIKLARPGQWIKNWVLLAALIFAGTLRDTQRLWLALAAVGIFCLLSSAVYTINDLIDRESDKQHPLKKDRPLASGRVGATQAIVMVVILLAAGLIPAWYINWQFGTVAVAFVLLNIAYSIKLKDLVIIDVVMLALSFVLRAYAGAVAISVPASKWLLITTFMLALFLGFGKRRHELTLLESTAGAHRKSLSHYSPYLLDQIIGVTTASVLVVYMLYTFSDEVSVKLGTQNLYLTIPFVVYGIFRYLYLIHRLDEGGSPTRVLFADKPILINVALWFVTVTLVLYHLW